MTQRTLRKGAETYGESKTLAAEQRRHNRNTREMEYSHETKMFVFTAKEHFKRESDSPVTFAPIGIPEECIFFFNVSLFLKKCKNGNLSNEEHFSQCVLVTGNEKKNSCVLHRTSLNALCIHVNAAQLVTS